MALKLSLGEKRMFWFFENGICFFYQISEWRRNNLLGQQDKALKTFSIKRFVRWSIAENGFEAILKWKTNFLWVFKCSVLGFWIFLIDKVESISKESKTKLSKLLESKVIRSILKHGFEVKNKCSEPLKMVFFSFLLIFER